MSGTRGVSIYHSANPAVGFRNDSRYHLWYASGNNMVLWNNVYGDVMRVINNYTEMVGSARAPIFYDLDNTAYYVDPTGTTNISILNMNNRIITNRNTIYLAGDNDYNHAIGNSLQTFNGSADGETFYGWHFINLHARQVGRSGLLMRENGYIGINNITNPQYGLHTSGTSYSDGDKRAPIFYDSNDTTYYIDPNTTGVSVRVAGQIWSGQSNSRSGDIGLVLNDGSVLVRASGDNYHKMWYYDGIAFGTNSAHGHFRFYGETNTQRNNSTGGANLWFDINATNGVAISYGDMRAPIFYDQNNTGYYVNPDGTTNLVYLVVANGNSIQHNAYNNNGSYMMNNASTYWGMMSNVSTNDWRLGYGGGNSIVGWNLRWDNGSTAWAQNFQANIMYDAQNTGYFVDPNGRSRLSSMDYGNGSYYLAGGDWGYRHNTPYGWIQFGPANSGHAHIYTDRGNFYFNVYEMYLNGYRVPMYGYNVGGSLYANVYYDSDNTGYYMDPTSDSNWNGLTLYGKNRIGLAAKENYRRSDYTGDSNHWTGARGWGTTSFNDQMNWGSGWGDSWGSIGQSPGDTSHYLTAQVYHYSYSGYGYGWQLTGGVTDSLWWRHSWPYPGGWFKIAMYDNNASAGGALWAGIFYDSNDSSFYFNGNGTTRWQGTDDYSKMRIGLTAKGNFRRNDYTGDSNYWVGSMGWGTTDLISVFTWGSGFFDTWSNPANQPAGTSHWTGVQALHYVSGYNSGYGWQLVGGPINGAWWTSYWSGKRPWYKLAMYSLNEYSSDFWASIYYDSNDSGYYMDPNSTSQAAMRIRGGMFMGPNPTWGAYFRVGSDNRPDGYASVTATNGNLHLDCQNGYETYINHYNGNRTYLYEIRTNFIYDRDNTGYYLDPNGDSQFNQVYANGWFRPQGAVGVYWQSYGRGIWAPDNSGSPYGNVATYGGGRNGWYGYAIDSTHCLMTTTGDNFGLHDNRYSWIWYWDGGAFNVYRGYSYFNQSARSPLFYDSDNTGFYFNTDSRISYLSNTNGGFSEDGGQFMFNSTRGYYNHYTNSPPLQCFSYGNNAAFMSFHKSSHYAINMGLDGDTVFRMGGWSAQAWFSQYDMSGNYYIRGGIYQYYSDERLKNILGRIPNALEKISQIDGFYYKSNELAFTAAGYDDNYKLQVGLSAQQVQKVLPEIVSIAGFDTHFPDPDDHSIITSKSGENYLTIQYEKITPLLIEGIRELKDELDELKIKVAELRTEVTDLEELRDKVAQLRIEVDTLNA
jgi:hypothetical protein